MRRKSSLPVSRASGRAFVAAAFLAAPLVLSLGVFAACSTGDEGSPTQPVVVVPSGDAPSTPEVNVAERPIPDEPKPTCTTVDITPGTGAKFCELPGADTPDLQVPPEFCVREFTTTPVMEARVLRFAPNGDLFVVAPSMFTPGGASEGAGAIVVLPDDNGDGRADAILSYAGTFPRGPSNACAPVEADPTNLTCVHGLLFADGYMYYTRSDEVRRVRHTAGDRALPAGTNSELVAKLGGAAINDVRWTHTLAQAKDGSIYVSRGRFDSSGCSADEMTRGAVFALHVETKPTLPITPELVANGFRNPMYLRCSPTSCGDCFANELSGDGWDSIGGREKVALLGKTKGQSWGYPCCVAPDLAAPGAPLGTCGEIPRESASIKLHDTPFGLDFDRGGFPEPYKHGLFIALHGVVSSFGGTGVVWLAADPVSLRPTGDAAQFTKGFAKPNGRATDVAFAPDGRLFIADDTAGKIYWIAPRTLAKP